MDGRGKSHLADRRIVDVAGKTPEGISGDVVVIRSRGFDWPDVWLRPVPADVVDWSLVERVAI